MFFAHDVERGFYYYGEVEPRAGMYTDFLTDPKVIAVDTETISLKERIAIGIGVSPNPGMAFYFPLFPEPSSYTPWYLLKDPSVKKIFQNAPFDLLCLREYEIYNGNISDTNVMAHLLNIIPSKLVDLISYVALHGGRLLEVHTVPELLEKYDGKIMLDLPQDTVAKKCMEDCLATFEVYNNLLPHVDKDYFNTEMEVIPVLIDMSFRGILLDQEVRARLEKSLEEEVNYYIDLAHTDGFNPGSNQQVGYILAKRGAYSVFSRIPFTKGRKNLNTSEKVLSKMSDPLAAMVLDYRAKSKLLTTYIRPWAGEERAYTRFHLDAITGRVSSTDRNLQNIPKGEIRNMFLPDSGVFTDADFCLAPWTMILKNNLEWTAIKDLNVGDSIIGIDEFPKGGKGNRRKLRSGIVESKCPKVLDSYGIKFNNGTFIVASGEHPWLTSKTKLKSEWIRTDQLKVGMYLRFFVEPWEKIESYDGGYVAGFLDGEGYSAHKHKTIGFGQNVGKTLDNILNKLDELGFDNYDVDYNTSYTGNVMAKVRFNDMVSSLKLLGMVKPQRLLDGLELDGIEPPTLNPAVMVTDIMPIGKQELISIQTSIHTFIAEGLFTHNSQIELRILAHMSGDREMQYIYESGGDIHQQTADFLNIPRRPSKNVNFAMVFGATDETIMETAHIRSLSRAKQLKEMWFDKYKEAGDWIQTIQEEALRNPYVTTLFGRRIGLPTLDEESESEIQRKAVNYRIQGSAAEVFKRAMIRCKDLPIVLQIHDEMVFDGMVELPRLDNIAPLNTPIEVRYLQCWE